MTGLQRDDPPLVLASGSTTRAGLLRAAGLRFTVEVARVDEAALKAGARAEGASAGEAALLLAEAKAARVARRWPEALVIGADQILECGGSWFDKPDSLEAAGAQLRALRGQVHALPTAVVCMRGGAVVWHHLATPRLRLRSFGDAFLDAYLALEGEAVLASVGAYRLEGPGAQLMAEVTGEHAAVLGLPMLALLGFLRDHGVLLN